MMDTGIRRGSEPLPRMRKGVKRRLGSFAVDLSWGLVVVSLGLVVVSLGLVVVSLGLVVSLGFFKLLTLGLVMSLGFFKLLPLGLLTLPTLCFDFVLRDCRFDLLRCRRDLDRRDLDR